MNVEVKAKGVAIRILVANRKITVLTASMRRAGRCPFDSTLADVVCENNSCRSDTYCKAGGPSPTAKYCHAEFDGDCGVDRLRENIISCVGDCDAGDCCVPSLTCDDIWPNSSCGTVIILRDIPCHECYKEDYCEQKTCSGFSLCFGDALEEVECFGECSMASAVNR